MVNVLCDWHHGALYYSMHLLFERRLGWDLYRPTGFDWYKKGYWRYSADIQTIKQYLEPPTSKKVHVHNIIAREGTHYYYHKAITFDSFQNMDFDFIIASVNAHEKPYRELAEMKDAVLIRQLGNPYEVCDFNICKNVMNSTTIPVPPGVNHVRYHPEFCLEDYCYTPPKRHKIIKSFLNCLPHTIDAPLWNEYEKEMPDFLWKMHGILGRDGTLPVGEVPGAMRDSSFIWHLKPQGDGYGFCVHQAYACGRPLILKKHYYNGQMAEPLFEDSVTCIDLDLGTKSENIEKIRYFSEPDNHAQMCENAYKRFKEHVNFDREFEEIKKFFKKIREK